MIQFYFQTTWETHSTLNDYTQDFDECDTWQQVIDSQKPKIRLQLSQLDCFLAAQFAPQLSKTAVFELNLDRQTDVVSTVRHLSDWVPFKSLIFNGLQRKELVDITPYLTKVEAVTFVKNRFKTLPKQFMHLNNLKYLDALSNDFPHFPKQILFCTQLTHLILSDNPIQHLPDELGALSQLEELHLENCLLFDLPESLGKLKSLRILHLSGNQFPKLPASLAQLTNLKVITLGGNAKLDLAQACEVLAALPNLQILNVNQMHLHQLPEAFYRLNHLQAAHWDKNPISFENEIRAGAQIQAPMSLSISDVVDCTEIPAELGRYTMLQSLFLHSVKNLQKMPAEMGHLKQLTDLKLEKLADLVALPDVFDQLTALETLFIQDCPALKAYPPSLYQAQSIHHLVLQNNGCKAVMSKIKQMTWLKNLAMDVPTPESLSDLTTLVDLEALEIRCKTPLKTLPEGFKNLKKLEIFHFQELPALNVPQAMAQLPYLTHVELSMIPFEVSTLPFPSTTRFIYVNNPISIQTIWHWMDTLPHLESITATVTDVQIPKNIDRLNHLKQADLNFTEPNLEVPLEWALLDRRKIRIQTDAISGRMVQKAIRRIETMHLSNPQHKILAFGLFMEQVIGLEAFVENPFTVEGDWNNMIFYVLGKPTWRNLTVLESTLNERGATWTEDWNEATHILVCNSLGYGKQLKTLLNTPKKFVLEVFLKQYELENAPPFLIEAENSVLNQSILELLCSEDTDNSELILEIIEGGGANKTLLSYVTAIYLKHPTESVRDAAQILFEQYASASLKAHISEHSQEDVDELNVNYVHHLYVHPEIDFFDGVIADKMMAWHQHRLLNAWHYEPSEHRVLFISNYDWSTGYSSLQRMPFIKSIRLEIPQNFDFELFIDAVKNLSLTRIELLDLAIGVDLTPLFALETLKHARVTCTHLDGLEIPLVLNSKLDSLELGAFKFTAFERLTAYVHHIRQLIVYHQPPFDPPLPF